MLKLSNILRALFLFFVILGAAHSKVAVSLDHDEVKLLALKATELPDREFVLELYKCPNASNPYESIDECKIEKKLYLEDSPFPMNSILKIYSDKEAILSQQNLEKVNSQIRFFGQHGELDQDQKKKLEQLKVKLKKHKSALAGKAQGELIKQQLIEQLLLDEVVSPIEGAQIHKFLKKLASIKTFPAKCGKRDSLDEKIEDCFIYNPIIKELVNNINFEKAVEVNLERYGDVTIVDDRGEFYTTKHSPNALKSITSKYLHSIKSAHAHLYGIRFRATSAESSATFKNINAYIQLKNSDNMIMFFQKGQDISLNLYEGNEIKKMANFKLRNDYKAEYKIGDNFLGGAKEASNIWRNFDPEPFFYPISVPITSAAIGIGLAIDIVTAPVDLTLRAIHPSAIATRKIRRLFKGESSIVGEKVFKHVKKY